MSIEIRDAAPQDCARIAELMHDFAEYEKLGHCCTITGDILADVMFGISAYVKGIVAVENDRMVAYALFYRNFASFRGQQGVYLEDIFLDQNYRGRGVGEAILKKVANAASELGALRIDFQVLDWNSPAVNFYEKLGAVSERDESHFKFVDEAFENLAKS